MGASLIATSITFETLLGALLVGASIILTTHSLARMIFLKRTASKYHLFPIINVTQLINQICVFFLITTAFDTISFSTALWLNVINNIAYLITKPTTMYLAYLRCSAVYPAFRKVDWLNFILIAFRAIELLTIVIVNIIQNILCNGSVAVGTRCANLAIAWTFRDASAPISRFYYIICEGIFYYKLFTALRGMAGGKNIELLQYRRLQTSLFTIDLTLLVIMSIYRIVGIFNTHIPTYVYYELFSSSLTIFTLTEFGLNIRMLFNTANGDGRGTSDVVSGGSCGPNGTQHSKLEMKSVQSNRARPLTNNSTSPLASNAADFSNGSEVDISTSPQHYDYVPHPRSFPAVGQQSEWARDPYSSNEPSVKFYNQEKKEPIPRTSLTYSIPNRSPTVPDRAFSAPLRSPARHRHDENIFTA
ncbi:hypothetical protein BGX21_003982 [Mortierella sp. AD011]|nr:hypothetical protein BGX20_004885 [Mortierella sp. AD010]KAF9400588.1 hypothetical protein BGX21_003982 [Mortierella sp. AD011]